MRWLTMRLHRGGRDRGATAVLVAILLPVVLLGIGAFVLDTGAWYAQRAQTQNGADAGAAAVAQSCAKGACDLGAADDYAPANSTGNMDTTSELSAGFPCGRDTVGNTLPTCPSGTENGTICPLPPATGNYVNVATNTLNTKDGTGLVPPLLGKALRGNGYQGQTIGSCAQASWGAPESLGNGTALTMSACEWDKDTAQGTEFAHVPAFDTDGTPDYSYQQGVPSGLPSYLDTITARSTDTDYIDPGTGLNYYVENTIKDPHSPVRSYSYDGGPLGAARIAGSETVLTAHGFGNNCKEGNSGGTAPGQFGWLSDDTCEVVIANGTYGGVTGTSSAPCEEAFTTSRDTGEPIFLPVYTGDPAGTGSGVTYTLLGFAAFVVTGWNMAQGNAGNWTVKKAPSMVTLADGSTPANNANYCTKALIGSNAEQCLFGFFTHALIPPSALSGGGTGGTNLGATSVQLTG